MSTSIVAIIYIAIGIAIYLRPKLPTNPNDDITVSLNEVFGMKFGTAKLIIDIVAILIALLLNGSIGIGTILLTLLLGPLVNVVNSIIDKFTETTHDSIEKSVA